MTPLFRTEAGLYNWNVTSCLGRETVAVPFRGPSELLQDSGLFN